MLPQNVPYLNVADESASVSIRSGKPLPLSDVNNSLPLGPAMLETLPYPLGALFLWIIARRFKLSTSLPPRA